MKRTPFYQKHIDLGAKIIPFTGYEMPVQYEGVNAEHMAVRKNCGIFDVSHMGEFMFKGDHAIELLQKLVCNDVTKIAVNQAQYSAMMYENGGIIDDLILYRLDEKEFLMVANAANIEKDFDWVNQQNDLGVEITNISDDIALLAVQGPNTTKILQPLTPVKLDQIKFYHFEKGTFAGVDNVIISGTGYTGSGGFELYFDKKYADTVWDAIIKLDVTPCGLASRDTLRLEKGYSLYGNDITDQTTTLEAGLGWVTKLDTDFIGKKALLKQKEEGLSRRLKPFLMIEKGIPRKDYKVVDVENNEIGFVTSGTMSPILKQGIGLAYLNKEFTKLDTEIYIQIRNKNVKAKVTKLPFV
ncbi:MAG: glycine cleavage system aminomethyltransferase GcvT [Flavobacteriales bacterium]